MRHLFGLVLLLILSTQMTAQESLESDWFMNNDNGISAKAAYEQILKNKNTATVIVAIIDSGMDIEHEDLTENMWVNADEIAGNGIDDDNNGYIDDVNGWNFIGGKDGQNVGPDSYEVTRVYHKLHKKYEGKEKTDIDKKDMAEFELYQKAAEEHKTKLMKAKENVKKIDGQKSYVLDMIAKLETALAGQPLTQVTLDSLTALEDPNVKPALFLLNQYIENEGEIPSIIDLKAGTEDQFARGLEYYQNQIDYAYNVDFDSRKIVGDDYANGREIGYGNSDAEGPDALHGTHVGGIVGAVRNNDIGMDGVAQNVKLMSIRAVPDGDERDKDVANAIRYAVDNGASIINMSFGKGYSWDKQLVDDAVRYAAKNDVLLVHAAGNSANDNDVEDNFPNDQYEKPKGFWFWKKKEAKNWIEVGALSYQKGEDRVATFSNYGQDNVDIFAPGVKIYATVPDDNYMNLQGTSMASPVVAGVAAVLRSVFPALTAVQVKDILMSTAVTSHEMVKKPGTEDKVPFSELSVSGGVVNLKAALIKAAQTKGKKKIKKSKKMANRA